MKLSTRCVFGTAWLLASAHGKTPATRADLRFGEGPDGKLFILNKRDGTIRMLVPNSK
jgi:hypothetical protein